MQSVKFIKDVDEGTLHCLISKEDYELNEQLKRNGVLFGQQKRNRDPSDSVVDVLSSQSSVLVTAKLNPRKTVSLKPVVPPKGVSVKEPLKLPRSSQSSQNRGAPAPSKAAPSSPPTRVKKAKKAPVWSIGDHVEVYEPHKNGYRDLVWTGSYHSGVITAADDNKFTVEFEPNDSVTVTSAKIFAVREAEIEEEYHVGQHVDVLYPKLGNSWWMGRIKKIVSNDTFKILFANGDEETVKLNRLRIHQE